MDSLKRAVKYLDEGVKNEIENNNLEAMANYSEALNCFTYFTNGSTAVMPQLKKEIYYQINFCKDRVNEIKSKTQSSPNNTKTAQCIMQEFLPKKKLRFDDLCGMEEIKTDLTHALITPSNRPKAYSRGLAPYRDFLLFGVR